MMCMTASHELNLKHVFGQVRQTGWLPQHVLLKTGGAAPQLLACCPLYLKSHSYGEYVFDHSWAGYFSRSGQKYYPKLQSCVPFTPATGNRLLVRPEAYAPAITKALGKGLTDIAGEVLAVPLPLFLFAQKQMSSLAFGCTALHSCQGCNDCASLVPTPALFKLLCKATSKFPGNDMYLLVQPSFTPKLAICRQCMTLDFQGDLCKQSLKARLLMEAVTNSCSDDELLE